MTEKLNAKIEWSSDALWGSTDAEDEGYDKLLSERAFVEILYGYMAAEHPDVEIEIVHNNHDRVTVNGEADHDAVPFIEDIISKTYNGNWEVCA